MPRGFRLLGRRNDRECLDGFRCAVEVLGAPRLEPELGAPAELPSNLVPDPCLARIRRRLEASSHVDPVAGHAVIRRLDHLADVEANPDRRLVEAIDDR